MQNEWKKAEQALNCYSGYLDGWICPKCGEIVYQIDDEIWRYIYCPWCGQKVLEDEQRNRTVDCISRKFFSSIWC